MINTYQRGNRDGLLALAAWADWQAAVWMAEVERCSKVLQNPVNQVQERAARHIESHALEKSTTYRQVAIHARLMSDRLPIDPEETP